MQSCLKGVIRLGEISMKRSVFAMTIGLAACVSPVCAWGQSPSPHRDWVLKAPDGEHFTITVPPEWRVGKPRTTKTAIVVINTDGTNCAVIRIEKPSTVGDTQAEINSNILPTLADKVGKMAAASFIDGKVLSSKVAYISNAPVWFVTVSGWRNSLDYHTFMIAAQAVVERPGMEYFVDCFVGADDEAKATDKWNRWNADLMHIMGSFYITD